VTREQLRRHVTATALWLALWNAWVAIQAVLLAAWATSPARSSSGLWWALAPTWGPVALSVGIVALFAVGFIVAAVMIWAWRHRRRPKIEVVETDEPPPEDAVEN